MVQSTISYSNVKTYYLAWFVVSESSIDPFWMFYQIIILTNDNINLKVKTLTGGNNWMTETYFTACDKGSREFLQGLRLH